MNKPTPSDRITALRQPRWTLEEEVTRSNLVRHFALPHALASD